MFNRTEVFLWVTPLPTFCTGLGLPVRPLPMVTAQNTLCIARLLHTHTATVTRQLR
jgi:hypothetical protein